MDFSWTDEEITLRNALRSYVEEHLTPGWTHFSRDDLEGEMVEDVFRFCAGMAERGLLIPTWPPEFGGRAASQWEQTVIGEELWGIGEPRGPQYMNVNWIGPAIMSLGTDAQREKYLGPMSRGEAMWCQGFSEPDAGSDLSALRTSAERVGDHYVVNGQKIWTSYANAADHCFLLVRTTKDENPRHGISVLLVPMDLEGIEVREIPTLGVSHLLHEVFFHDVRVPVDCRLGEEDDGWRIIRVLLADERVGNARHEWVDRTLNDLVREAFEAGLDTNDDRFWETLGRSAAWGAAGRVLNYVAVQAQVDGSDRYTNVAATYRALAGQMELNAAYAYLDVLGPEALIERSGGDFQLLEGTIATIGGGSVEMHLNSIVWYVLGLPKGS